jgi:hypothetical protein
MLDTVPSEHNDSNLVKYDSCKATFSPFSTAMYASPLYDWHSNRPCCAVVVSVDVAELVKVVDGVLVTLVVPLLVIVDVKVVVVVVVTDVVGVTREHVEKVSKWMYALNAWLNKDAASSQTVCSVYTKGPI